MQKTHVSLLGNGLGCLWSLMPLPCSSLSVFMDTIFLKKTTAVSLAHLLLYNLDTPPGRSRIYVLCPLLNLHLDQESKAEWCYVTSTALEVLTLGTLPPYFGKAQGPVERPTWRRTEDWPMVLGMLQPTASTSLPAMWMSWMENSSSRPQLTLPTWDEPLLLSLAQRVNHEQNKAIVILTHEVLVWLVT